jgi:hypothetical protein
MSTPYNSLNLFTNENGILLQSNISIDFPIVIMCNKAFGIVVIHGNDVIYDLRSQISNQENLDLKNQCLRSLLLL